MDSTWVLFSLVRYIQMTENPAMVDAYHERFTKLNHDIGDEVFEIVNSDMFEKEIMQLKALYLTDKGFYVPDELRNNEDMMRMGLGKYANGGPNADRVLNTNKMMMVESIEEIQRHLNSIDSIYSDHHDFFAISLIDCHNAMNFQLYNTLNLIKFYELINSCNADIKLIAKKPHTKNFESQKLEVLTLHKVMLEDHFVKWDAGLNTSRDKIATIAGYYHTNIDHCDKTPFPGNFMLSQCKILKSYCKALRSYHKKMAKIFKLLMQQPKHCNLRTFSMEVNEYIQILLCYDGLYAQLFAEKISERRYQLRQNSPNDNDLNNLILLNHAILGRMWFLKDTMRKNLLYCKTILRQYNDVNCNVKLLIVDFIKLDVQLTEESADALKASLNSRKADLFESDENVNAACKQFVVMFGLIACVAVLDWYL